MKLDKLKQSWKDMNMALKRAEAMNTQLRQQLTMATMRPQRERIRSIFMRLMIVCYLSPLPVCLSLSGMDLVPLWLCVLLAIFFLWTGTANAILYYRMGKIDLNIMNVKEALVSVLDFKKLRCRFKIANMSVGLPLVIIMLWYFSMEEGAIDYAGVIGAVIGAFLGLKIDLSIRKQIKELETTLRDELRDY